MAEPLFADVDIIDSDFPVALQRSEQSCAIRPERGITGDTGIVVIDAG